MSITSITFPSEKKQIAPAIPGSIPTISQRKYRFKSARALPIFRRR